MLTTDNSPALVKGAGGQPQPETEKRVVLRAFLLNGQRQEVGATVELPWRQAREFDAMNKTAPCADSPAEVTETDGPDSKPKKGARK